MALIEEEPPSTLPRGSMMRLPEHSLSGAE